MKINKVENLLMQLFIPKQVNDLSQFKELLDCFKKSVTLCVQLVSKKQFRYSNEIINMMCAMMENRLTDT